jgi:hypothetical protein
MCEGFDVRAAETDARNRAERLRRFLDPGQWHRSTKGNLTRKCRGWTVTVFEDRGGRWRYFVKKKRQKHCPWDPYPTEREAMLGLFAWHEKFGGDA